jgi:hypothetical protein
MALLLPEPVAVGSWLGFGVYDAVPVGVALPLEPGVRLAVGVVVLLPVLLLLADDVTVGVEDGDAVIAADVAVVFDACSARAERARRRQASARLVRNVEPALLPA